MKARLAIAALSVALGGAAGYQHFREHEGLRLQAYPDTGNVWTICYGHTRTAAPGKSYTKQVCEELLRQDVAVAERQLKALLPATTPMTYEQYLVSVDFVFNLGPGKFQTSTLRREILAGRCLEAGAQFRVWNKGRVDGQLVVLPGLTKRANWRAEQWLTGC